MCNKGSISQTKLHVLRTHNGGGVFMGMQEINNWKQQRITKRTMPQHHVNARKHQLLTAPFFFFLFSPRSRRDRPHRSLRSHSICGVTFFKDRKTFFLCAFPHSSAWWEFSHLFLICRAEITHKLLFIYLASHQSAPLLIRSDTACNSRAPSLP